MIRITNTIVIAIILLYVSAVPIRAGSLFAWGYGAYDQVSDTPSGNDVAPVVMLLESRPPMATGGIEELARKGICLSMAEIVL